MPDTTPGPTPAGPATPVVDGWFTTDDAPRLLAARCTACAAVWFPPTGRDCPNPVCEARQEDAGGDAGGGARAVAAGHGVVLHRRALPAAAPVHPAAG